MADIAIKHSTPRNLMEAIKWSCRGSPAHRAFHLARRIHTMGFLTALPIAAGERRAAGVLRESYLLTQFITGATPLHLVNASCTDRRRRLRIVRGLAKLYAAMHDAGFYHHDPSQANFLVVPQLNGGDSVALIDLDGLRQRREIKIQAAADDLRRLLMRCRIPRRERAWFIVVYSLSRKTAVESRQLVKLIGPLPEQATFPHCALNEESHPEKIDPAVADGFLENRIQWPARPDCETQSLERDDLIWVVRPALLNQRAQNIFAAPDEFLARARVLKPSRSSAVSAQDGLVLKRYNFRKWRNLFKDLFRGSKARRCFFRGMRLEQAGIHTARPIAFAEQHCCGVSLRSYLLMEEIPQATNLTQWRGDKHRAIQSLARLIARLHDAGFVHRDLKEGNILFDGSGKPFLVDLDGLHYVRRCKDGRAAADLARLAQAAINRPGATRSDRVRFLQTYCRMRRRADWRSWWRSIAAGRA